TGRPTVRLPLGALGFPTPFAANGGAGYNQMSLIYDTLLWKDSSGQLLPWLARSSTTSADHLTYGFELRDNAMWSDGRPVTPADVVFTFDYFAKQTLPPPVTIQGPEGVSKVVATGPRSVEITLEKPNVTFLEQVAASLPIVPEHVWSGISRAPDAQDVKVLIGSGAYRLESYKGDSEALSFVARDDYHLGRPYVGRIESTPIDDEFSGLLSGSTDVARGVGLRPDTLAPFKGNSRFGMVSQQGNSATCLYFNLTKGGPIADPKFRRACAMAIDGKDIVARLAAGNGRPGNPGFLGPDNPFSSGGPPIGVDIAGAGQLLDGAGYRDTGSGTRQGPAGPLSFELLIGNNDVPVGEILVAALKRIGVELKLKAVEPGPQLFGTKLFAGYQLAVLFYPGPSAGGPNGDPDVLRQLFSSASPPSLTGATGYANPVFDDLAERQRITFDEAERKAIVGQMQKILAEDLPILALYYPETTLLFRTQVLDEWYFTPGQYPTTEYNKQLFITGRRTGTEIRPGR
ncbi:MAG: ABC transporter substrate-binding protein, partial [Acidimicrobiales bacterium]